jgi:hypothetical protein
MARSGSEVGLLDLPLEVLADVCLRLGLRDILCVADTSDCLRHGDGRLETAELPTKSPVVTALREHAFPGGALIPSTRPIGCSESWVSYLGRCARQRRCREAPPVVAGVEDSLFLDAAGRLLVCGDAYKWDQHEARMWHLYPAPVAVTPWVRVRSMAAGEDRNLALGWDGRVYSWGGMNAYGQLGHGEEQSRNMAPPALVEGLEGVCSVAAGYGHSFAVTESEDVLRWGISQVDDELECEDQPILPDGFEGVCMRRVYAHECCCFAIGEAGELFSWAPDVLNIEGPPVGPLGHCDVEDALLPKRVEALQGVQVSCVSLRKKHGLALAEDGLVYAWSYINCITPASDTRRTFTRELLPKPVEALRGVRVGSIAQGGDRSYAVADTGELWTWETTKRH